MSLLRARTSVVLCTALLLVACSPGSAGNDARAGDAAHADDGGQSDDSDVARDVASDTDSSTDTDEGCRDGGCEPPMVTRDFEALAGEVLNPERGLYRPVSLLDQTDLSGVRADGRTLVYSYIRLDDFRDRAMPDEFLDRVDAALGQVRDNGLKLVLRFAYNFGPYPDSEPDAPLEQVLAHLDQLEPLLDKHSDSVAVMQAGFIGAWGEWHTSTNNLTTPENQEAILNGILAALPEDRATQIRYPWAKMQVFGTAPLTSEDAFSGTSAARVGHHNDCFLASDTDLGTYGRGDASMDEELAYLEQETRFVPMGGETCGVSSPRSDCESALAEMERLHFSYLNDGYHQDVLDGWREQGCFETIRDRLGYRFVLREMAHSSCVRPGGLLALRLALENEGFAAPFNERPVRLVLRRGEETHWADIETADPRRWEPGEPIDVEATFRLPADLEPGDWQLAIWLPDASDSLADNPSFAIRLANQDVWEAATGLNLLGSQCVDDAAPGAVDTSADAFVEIR